MTTTSVAMTRERITGDAYRALCARLGYDLRGGRSVATDRGGRRESMAHDIPRGLWHDHATGEGGDAIDLIARVRGCSIGDALDWAEAEGYRTPSRRLTAREIAEQKRRREGDERHRLDVTDFRAALDSVLDKAKLAAGEVGDDEALEAAASLQYQLALAPAAVMAAMLATDAPRVLTLIHAGRDDRAEAARLTARVVAMIAGAAVEREQWEALHDAA